MDTDPRLDEYLFGIENGSRDCAGIDLALKSVVYCYCSDSKELRIS